MESNAFDEVKAWADFYEKTFGYKLPLSGVYLGEKPSYPCASIVIPKDDFAETFKKKGEYWPWQPPLQASLARVYDKGLDVFPYSRWTSKPVDYWNATNFFTDVEDVCIRPPKPYLVWVKIRDFADKNEGSWEERWDRSPGTTLLEQMLLDLFWWDKHKTPFGLNTGEGWKTTNCCLALLTLCNGSRFKKGCQTEKEYNANPLRKFFGHADTYLIPEIFWGNGGWAVGSIGYKSATTPTPFPFVISF